MYRTYLYLIETLFTRLKKRRRFLIRLSFYVYLGTLFQVNRFWWFHFIWKLVIPMCSFKKFIEIVCRFWKTIQNKYSYFPMIFTPQQVANSMMYNVNKCNVWKQKISWIIIKYKTKRYIDKLYYCNMLTKCMYQVFTKLIELKVCIALMILDTYIHKSEIFIAGNSFSSSKMVRSLRFMSEKLCLTKVRSRRTAAVALRANKSNSTLRRLFKIVPTYLYSYIMCRMNIRFLVVNLIGFLTGKWFY